MSSLLSRRTLIISLYTLYGIIIALCFVYYRFPYDLALGRFLDAHDREAPFQVKVGSLEPLTPPLAFRVEGLDLVEKNTQNNATLLHIKQILLKPYLSSLFRGVPEGELSGTLYGGTVSGSIALEGVTGKGAKIRTAVKSLHLNEWKTAEKLWGIKPVGIAQAGMHYSGDLSRWWEGAGEAELSVTDGAVTGLSRLMVPIDGIDQCSLSARLSMSGRKLNIVACALESRQGKAEVVGAVFLVPDLPQSRLDIVINLSIDPAWKKEMRLPMDNARFTVKGTVGQPVVKFQTGR